MLQKPHALGGFGLTTNVLTETSVKVLMGTRFLGFVGSFPLEEQKLWLPNQLGHDPNSWTVPHLLSVKMDYDVLVNKYGSKV
jgi:hypothetical protein